jgi:hypothetical protein
MWSSDGRNARESKATRRCAKRRFISESDADCVRRLTAKAYCSLEGVWTSSSCDVEQRRSQRARVEGDTTMRRGAKSSCSWCQLEDRGTTSKAALAQSLHRPQTRRHAVEVLELSGC